MKVLSIIFCIWAAVNGHPYITDVGCCTDDMTDDYNMAEDYNLQEDYNAVEIVPPPSSYVGEISEQKTDEPVQELLSSLSIQSTDESANHNIPEDYNNIKVGYNGDELVLPPSSYVEEISEEPTDQPSYVVETTDDDPVQETNFWFPTTDDDDDESANYNYFEHVIDNNGVESSPEPSYVEKTTEQLSYVEQTTDEPGQENSFSIQIPDVSADPLIIDDCEQLARARNNSVRTIITRSEGIHKCIPDLTRVLKSGHSAVIFLGLDAMDSLHLNEQNKLFFDKYYELPEHIQNIRNYVYDNKLDVKVYVTSDVITGELFDHIIFAKYEEAVDLSKYLFRYKSEARAGREIITNVVNRLLESDYYGEIKDAVMNYAFKLLANDAWDIVNYCFPSILKSIFYEGAIQILSKDNTVALNLSPELDDDNNNYQWLYSDCPGNDGRDMHWRFIATWNSTLESVVFKIRHIRYVSNLNLAEKTIGHYNEEREAFGDRSINIEEGPEGQEWRLIPTNFKNNGDLLFCIFNEAYNSYLIPNSGKCDKRDVRGMSRYYCDKEIGWKILGEN